MTTATTITEQRATYRNLKQAGRLSGTIKECMSKRAGRDANQPIPRDHGMTPGRILAIQDQQRAMRSNPVRVPLGKAVANHWLDIAKADEPRLREWSHGARSSTHDYHRGFGHYTTGSNRDWSKRSTFQRGIEVTSYATCPDFRAAKLRLGTFDYTIFAPRGYRWDIDANGLMLRKCGQASGWDYHPTASELLDARQDRGRGLVAVLKEARATRLAAEREAKRREKQSRAKARQEQEAIKRAEREGATVCLADSLRAGNCRAGSESWAIRHGLDARRHYTPSEILSHANGDASRVALVITAALRRHRTEMARGYADLADHTV